MRMKMLSGCVLLGIVAAFAVHARAQSKAQVAAAETETLKKSVAGKAAKLLGEPAGVFDVERGPSGEVLRLKTKGEADVPTSMRGTRADRYAREKATREAKAAFTKWLSEKVVFSENEAEAVVIQEKNGTESSEVLNTSAKLYSSHSSALLNGLIPLLDQVSGEGAGRVAVVVLGWSQKLSFAAKSVKGEMSGAPSGKNAASSTAPAPAAGARGNTGTVTRTAKDMENF